MADWTKVSNIKGPKGDIGPIGPMPVVPPTWPRIFYITQPGPNHYVVPSDVKCIFVEIVGAGGPGTWTSAVQVGESSAGGGGGAGGYAACYLPWTNLADPTWSCTLEAEYDCHVGIGMPSGISYNFQNPYHRDEGATWFGPVEPRYGTQEFPVHLIFCEGGLTPATMMGAGSTPNASAAGSMGGGAWVPPHGVREQGAWGGCGLRIGGEVCISGRGANSAISHGGGLEKVLYPILFRGGEGNGGTGFGCGGSGGISSRLCDDHNEVAAMQAHIGGSGMHGVIKISEYLK
jgi:hypothetical protein